MVTDDLRAAISGAVMFASTGHPLGRVFSDPEHRMAIFQAMGLDVREGWLDDGDDLWEAVSYNDHAGHSKPCYVVTPRAEATDD